MNLGMIQELISVLASKLKTELLETPILDLNNLNLASTNATCTKNRLFNTPKGCYEL